MKKNHPIIGRTIRSIVTRMTEQSYVTLGGMYACMIGAFGLTYFGLATLTLHNGPSIGGGPWFIRFFNSFYFSIITAASVGYGDISPHGISKIFASIESLFSLFVFAILVSKPVSERQEVALYQMHKLTLDEIFTSIREGFFIMRKDFDTIVEEVESTKALSVRSIENFETALHQGQVLIEDIPTFYDSEKQLYTIDLHREELLGEAVLRTFERLLTTITTLEENKISLGVKTRKILDELLRSSKRTMMKWRGHSSKNVHTLIDASLAMLPRIEVLIK